MLLPSRVETRTSPSGTDHTRILLLVPLAVHPSGGPTFALNFSTVMGSWKKENSLALDGPGAFSGMASCMKFGSRACLSMQFAACATGVQARAPASRMVVMSPTEREAHEGAMPLARPQNAVRE